MPKDNMGSTTICHEFLHLMKREQLLDLKAEGFVEWNPLRFFVLVGDLGGGFRRKMDAEIGLNAV